MKKATLVAAIAAAAAAAGATAVLSSNGSAQGPVMVVYKSPTCGCCTEWVKHVKKAGFRVEVHDTADVQPVKDRWGVPKDMVSCHTAKVDGYAIEGHVPADLIQRLLQERPAVVGIAAPGMPIGSPGMEGGAPEPYDVLTFDKEGRTELFAKR
jgi:hypothetical protein